MEADYLPLCSMRMILTWIILGAVLYRLLNRYILPVFRISATTNDRLKEMQKQMKEMNSKLDQQPIKRKRKDGDYIDYEDLK